MAKGNALINLDWPHWGAMPWTINLFKQCFSQQAPLSPVSYPWQLELDAYGFPKAGLVGGLPTYRIDNYFQTWQLVNGYAGKYRVQWQGKAGQVTLSIGVTSITASGVDAGGSIAKAGGDINFYGSNGWVEFYASGTVQGVIHFEKTGAPWDGTCRNMVLMRLDDATDQANGKMVRKEIKDYFKVLNVRVLRTMDMNGINNSSGALWKYRRKPEEFDWFGSSRYIQGAWVGDISGTNNYTCGLGTDHTEGALTHGWTLQGNVLIQQNGAPFLNAGGFGAKAIVSIGGGAMTSPTGTVTDTVFARTNTFVYHGLLGKFIWNAVNFQQGFGMDDGVPWEALAELAIDVGCDLYVNIPINYDAPSIQALGALLGGLFKTTTLKVYAEHGNENWNQKFSQGQMMGAIATALGFTAAAPANGDVNLARFSAQGYLHRVAMEAFATGWTGAGASMNYLVRVLGVQAQGSQAAVQTYCLNGVQLGAYGYATVGNRPVDYTDLVVDAPYIAGGTLQASYNWNVDNINSSMMSACTSAADSFASGGAGINTALQYVDSDMRQGPGPVYSPDTDTLYYYRDNFFKTWDALIGSYNSTRTKPLRHGNYEGGTEIYWPSVDQCTSFEISPNYGTGTGTAAKAWAASGYVSNGELRTNASKLYKAMAAGYAGTTAPTHASGSSSDGSITWKYLGASTLNVGTVGGDKIKNMVVAWRNSSLAATFLQNYYDELMKLPNMALPGQYCHFLGAEANWANQWGFYSTPDSGLTTGLKAANAKAKRLMRLNGA